MQVTASASSSLQAVSDALNQTKLSPLPGKGVHDTPQVLPADIEWADKLDRKMELGYVPKASEQERYNQIISQLQSVRDGGGYAYQDTRSFSSNPRGFSAIGSLVGRTLSGGYIGYRYSGQVAVISRTSFSAIKQGITTGDIPAAIKGLAVGLKQGGAVALKAGAISSAINAGTSIVANISETIAGRQTGTEAVGNVTADTVGGFLSGIGATVFSGGATLGLSLAGTVGLPLTIIGVAGGAVGSLLLDKAYKGSGLFSVIKLRTMQAIDSHQSKKGQTVTPALPTLENGSNR